MVLWVNVVIDVSGFFLMIDDDTFHINFFIFCLALEKKILCCDTFVICKI